MKAVLALAASLSIVSASILPRQLDQIPPCALQCALGSIPDTKCPTTDFACICNATAFIEGLVPCVQRECSADQFQATSDAAVGLCKAAGVDLVIPTGVATTGASSTAPASTSEPAETTEASTTAPSTETSSAATTSAAVTTTQPPATTAGGNGTSTGTRPPNPTGTEPGAASRNTVALGGLGAIVAFVAAFL